MCSNTHFISYYCVINIPRTRQLLRIDSLIERKHSVSEVRFVGAREREEKNTAVSSGRGSDIKTKKVTISSLSMLRRILYTWMCSGVRGYLVSHIIKICQIASFSRCA